MSYEEPTRKTMTSAQIAYYTGKRVDSTKWVIPEGYGFCAITAKMLPESELLVTFAHHHFTKEQRAQLGAYGAGWCEDADWLSEEGYEVIMSRVEACGLKEVYEDGYWGPISQPEPAPQEEDIVSVEVSLNTAPIVDRTREALPRVRTARKEEAATIVERTKRYLADNTAPATPLVNLDTLIGAQIAAKPLDDLRKNETFIGEIAEIRLSKYGTFGYFITPDLVGGKWIKLDRIVGFAYFAETQKAAS